MSFERGKDRYRWTLNNYSEADLVVWQNAIDLVVRGNKKFTYIVFQEEIAPTTGTPHLQGYCEMRTRTRMTTLNRLNDTMLRTSWGECAGNGEHNKAYCTKTASRKPGTEPYEYGVIRGNTGQGNRSDLKDVVELIQGGCSRKEMMTECGTQYLKYHGGMDKMQGAFTSPRAGAPKLTIYFGETGRGKSWMANYLNPDAYWVPEPTGGRWWWPGYDGQKTIIIDEFESQYCKFTRLDKLLDHNPFVVEEKGRSMQLEATKIIITTNTPPQEWYRKLPNRVVGPLIRRIKEFTLKEDGTRRIYEFHGPQWDASEWNEEEGTGGPRIRQYEMPERTPRVTFRRQDAPVVADPYVDALLGRRE